MKVKTILVSQPKPKTETSPYFDLSDKQKVKIDFRSFIHVEGMSVKEVRGEKVDLNDFTAIILTSRNAVDHFFRIAEEMRFKVPDTTDEWGAIYVTYVTAVDEGGTTDEWGASEHNSTVWASAHCERSDRDRSHAAKVNYPWADPRGYNMRKAEARKAAK